MIDEILENIETMIRSTSLETVALVLILATVVLSLTTSMLAVFEVWEAARIVATMTMISLLMAFVSLAVGLLLNKGGWV